MLCFVYFVHLLFCSNPCLHRLPIPKSSEKVDQEVPSFNGLSAKFISLLWILTGSFLMMMFLANFFPILLLPAMEDPVDTMDDVVERGLIPIAYPGATYVTDIMNMYEDPQRRKLGEKIIYPDDVSQLEEMVWDDILFGDDKYVWITQYLLPGSLMRYQDFHISKETVGGTDPWSTWFINKKFFLQKKLKRHIMVFQHVKH